MCLMAIKTSLSASVVIIKYQITQVLDLLHLPTTYKYYRVCFASVTLYSIDFQYNSPPILYYKPMKHDNSRPRLNHTNWQIKRREQSKQVV